MAHKVFISKEVTEVQDLQAYLASNGDRLVAHSFLHFEKADFEYPSAYDVIFFGSPRAVIFFTTDYVIPEDKLIACSGSKTSELLTNLGYNVGFVGQQSGDMKKVAASFKKWCGDKHILFPTSNISLKTIASEFSENQKTELVIYNTEISTADIEESDTYVFTSPSNVKGFLEKNTIPENAHVIAWGESTASALATQNIKVSDILSAASIGHLIDVLKKPNY